MQAVQQCSLRSADFTVIAKDAELYVAPNANIKNSAENAAENGTAAVVCEDDKAAVEAAKNILTKLPQNNLSPVPMYEFADPTEAVGDDADGIAKAVCDGDSVTELNAEYGKAFIQHLQHLAVLQSALLLLTRQATSLHLLIAQRSQDL